MTTCPENSMEVAIGWRVAVARGVMGAFSYAETHVLRSDLKSRYQIEIPC